MSSGSFHQNFERDKREFLGELRQECGWPATGEFEEGADPELMWEYIEALENAYTAYRRVARYYGGGSSGTAT